MATDDVEIASGAGVMAAPGHQQDIRATAGFESAPPRRAKAKAKAVQMRGKAGTVVRPKELEVRGLDKLLDPQVIL